MNKTSLAECYDPEHYNDLIGQVSKFLLQSYQTSLNGEGKVTTYTAADVFLQEVKHHPVNALADVFNLLKKGSIKIHHPKYMGHQVAAPLPLAIVMDWIAAHFNNGMAVYEMGQLGSVLDKLVIEKMKDWLMLSPKADGILTNGGSVGNLTALLAAKSQYKRVHPPAILVSEEAHYSLVRAAQIMGIPKAQVFFLPTDSQARIDIEKIPEIFNKIHEQGFSPMAIIANACSTSTGSFDPINQLADIAEEHGIWLHVDGAHAGAYSLCPELAHYTTGINRADSIVIDFHKMLLCPALATGVFYKNGDMSFYPFEQKAAYLLADEPEWENMAMRTLECTKYMMSLKVFGLIELYGKHIFQEFILRQHKLTQACANFINNTDDFELAIEPQANILCFRLKNFNDEFQLRLREYLLTDGEFYIVKTVFRHQTYLRCTFMNPFTTIGHFKDLIDKIRRFKN